MKLFMTKIVIHSFGLLNNVEIQEMVDPTLLITTVTLTQLLSIKTPNIVNCRDFGQDIVVCEIERDMRGFYSVMQSSVTRV